MSDLVERFPAHWPLMTLGEVARWGSGGTPKATNSSYYGGDIPWAVIGDLNDGVVNETAKTITQAGLSQSSAKLVEPGAVLIAMYGSIGKLGIVGRRMATNQAIAFAYPDESLVDSKYLFWYLMAQRRALGTAGKGATQSNISQTVLKAWPVPVAPIDEQRRIVEAIETHLSHLDAGIASLKRAKKNVERMRVSVLRGAAAGELGQLSAPPDEWIRCTIGDLVGPDGVFSDGDWVESKDQDPNGEVRLIQLADIGDGWFRDRSQRFLTREKAEQLGCSYLSPGDLLIARMPDPLGRACVFPDVGQEAVTAVDVCIVRPDPERVRVDWLMNTINAPHFRGRVAELQSGTTRKRISRRNLATIELAVPSLVDQDAILQEVDVEMSLIAAVEKALRDAMNRSARLKRSVLSSAFSGDLVLGASQ